MDFNQRPEQRQEMTLEMQLESIHRQLRELRATQDILINYVQVVALALGLKDKIRALDAQLEELREG